MPTRDAKRRGLGWLPGLADIGWSNRLGWYEGFHLLLAVNPEGIMTGYGFGRASSKDQVLAETFFALRTQAHRHRLPSAGAPAQGPYMADKGFEGKALHRLWWLDYGAQLICPPKRNSRQPWSRAWHRWLAALRQIVGDKLQHAFHLDRERPHGMLGFQARLATKAALHNFCIWFDQQLGRPKLSNLAYNSPCYPMGSRERR